MSPDPNKKEVIMNRRELIYSIGALSLAMNTKTAFANEGIKMNAPIAKKIPITIKQLGRTRTDDYAWMRDENWRDVLNDPSKLNTEIRSYLVEENNYTKSVLLDKTTELRETLFKEMRARIKEDDSSPPSPDGEYSYYRRFREGGQYPVIARKKINPVTKEFISPEQILIDGDKEAKPHKFWKLVDYTHNKSQDFISYSVDYEGARNCDIYFRIVSNSQNLSEKLENTTGDIVWAKDNRTVFYVKNDAEVRPVKVMRHIIGTDPKSDVLVYQEKDPAYFVGLSESSSGEYVFIVSEASDHTECRYLPLETPTAKPVLFSKRKAGFEYLPDHHGDYFYFKTNKDKATDYKIMRTSVQKPSPKDWEDYIPYSDGTLVDNFILYKDYMARIEMFDALPRITIHELASKSEHVISFNEEAFDLDLIGGFEFDTNIVRFGYSSPSTPYESYDYNMQTKERVLVKRQEIPSGHKKEDYIVKRVQVPSGGVNVPLTLLYKNDTPIDGTAPVYLYGYGSYGITMPDSFGANILNLVNRGFICAVAHIRGGMERGYNWYQSGKMRKKQNTFTDFINCGKFLIDNNYTKKGNIYAEGRSAGGLLMGVVVNQAPELFGGIVAGVAFVDMMNTISDDTLPLTPPEWTEWGNPIKDVGDYDTMAAYSPYDNVETRAYPPIFAQTALSDSQVTYWEPAKWIAKLRATSPNAGPFLLNVNMEAGHGGASGRFDRLKEIADAQAFVLWCAKRG